MAMLAAVLVRFQLHNGSTGVKRVQSQHLVSTSCINAGVSSELSLDSITFRFRSRLGVSLL